MTARDFNASIRKSCHFLKDCKLLRSETTYKSHYGSSEFRKLALTPATPYRNLFLCGLRNSDYNCLLTDYSYLQFTFIGQDHYRFAYYPTPFANSESLGEYDQLLNAGVITFEEYSDALSDQSCEVTKPLIRFELDYKAYVRLLHPAAHFHIGMHSENRWPVCRRLTPRSFSLLVVKLYYGSDWADGVLPQDADGFNNRYDQFLVAEKADCKLIQKDFFHDHERNEFHFF